MTPALPARMLPPESPWLRPEALTLTRRLLACHQQAFGRALVAGGDARLADRQAAQALFATPLVVLAHDGSDDPRLTYANRTALYLWRHSWSTLVGLPSRLTAEPGRRAERQTMLEQAKAVGAIDGYTGVRIDSQGRRFLIRRARLWSLLDRSGRPCGQAAAFSDWCWLA